MFVCVKVKYFIMHTNAGTSGVTISSAADVATASSSVRGFPLDKAFVDGGDARRIATSGTSTVCTASPLMEMSDVPQVASAMSLGEVVQLKQVKG